MVEEIEHEPAPRFTIEDLEKSLDLYRLLISLNPSNKAKYRKIVSERLEWISRMYEEEMIAGAKEEELASKWKLIMLWKTVLEECK